MGLMTLGAIKDEIRAAVGNRTDWDSRLNNVVNIALTRLARLKDFDELRGNILLTTAFTGDPANDKFLSISPIGRYRKIYDVRLYADNQLSRKLIKVLPSKWDSAIPEPEYYAVGTPKYYMRWTKTQLELWRVPDRVYNVHIRYSRWPNQATDAKDGSVIDIDEADDIIIHLSASYLFLLAGNTERSNEHYKIYAALAREAAFFEEEDFDTHMSAVGPFDQGTGSRGYDDPFVQEMPR